MGTTEEILNLGVKVDNAQALEEARRKLEAFKEEAVELDAQLQSGYVSKGQHDAAMKRIGQGAADAAREIKKFEDAAEKAKGNLAGLGKAGTQVGYAMQDAVAGFQNNGLAGAFGALNNNITGLVRSLGFGAGLAGGLQIAGAVIQAFTPLVKSLIESFDTVAVDTFAHSIDGLKEKVKFLEEKPMKAAVDISDLVEARRQLDQLTKAQDAYHKLMGRQTLIEKESGQAVGKAIGDTQEAKDQIRAARTKYVEGAVANDPLMAQIRDEIARTERAMDMPMLGGPGGSADAARQGYKQQLGLLKESLKTREEYIRKIGGDQQFGVILEQAEQGKSENIKGLANHLRKAGQKKLADQLDTLTPERLQADADARVEQGKAIIEEAKRLKLFDLAADLKATMPDAPKKADVTRMQERLRNTLQTAKKTADTNAESEHKKFVGDYAKAFAHSEGGTRPLTDDFTPESVLRDLVEGGMDEAKARANAVEIHKEAQRLADEKVAQHALDMGPNVSASDAAVDLFTKYEESELSKAEGKEAKAVRRAGETVTQRAERLKAEKAKRIADKAQRERDAEAKRVAGAYDQVYQPAVEAAFNRNHMGQLVGAPGAVPDARLAHNLQGQIAQNLLRTGAVDAEGKKLTQQQAEDAAKVMVGKGQQALAAKMQQAMTVNGDAMQAMLALQAQQMAAFEQEVRRGNHFQQAIGDLQRNARTNRRPGLSRIR